MLTRSLIHVMVIMIDVANTDLMRLIRLESVAKIVVEQAYAIGITFRALTAQVRHLIFRTQPILSATGLHSLMFQSLQLFNKINIPTKVTECQVTTSVSALAFLGLPITLLILLVVISRNQRHKLSLLILSQHIRLLDTIFQPHIH